MLQDKNILPLREREEEAKQTSINQHFIISLKSRFILIKNYYNKLAHHKSHTHTHIPKHKYHSFFFSTKQSFGNKL